MTSTSPCRALLVAVALEAVGCAQTLGLDNFEPPPKQNSAGASGSAGSSSVDTTSRQLVDRSQSTACATTGSGGALDARVQADAGDAGVEGDAGAGGPN